MGNVYIMYERDGMGLICGHDDRMVGEMDVCMYYLHLNLIHLHSPSVYLSLVHSFLNCRPVRHER